MFLYISVYLNWGEVAEDIRTVPERLYDLTMHVPNLKLQRRK